MYSNQNKIIELENRLANLENKCKTFSKNDKNNENNENNENN